MKKQGWIYTAIAAVALGVTVPGAQAQSRDRSGYDNFEKREQVERLQSRLGGYRFREHRSAVQELAHRLEAAAGRTLRLAAESAGRPSRRERQTLERLRELELTSSRFHSQLESRRQRPDQSLRAFEQVLRSYARAAEAMRGFDARRGVYRAFGDVRDIMDRLVTYYGGYEDYGYRSRDRDRYDYAYVPSMDLFVGGVLDRDDFWPHDRVIIDRRFEDYRFRSHLNTVQRLAHQLEESVGQAYRLAAASSHHGDRLEREALARLDALEDAARLFHGRMERYDRHPLESVQDFERLLRAYVRTAETLDTLHGLPEVYRAFARVQETMTDLVGYYGGYGEYGYRYRSGYDYAYTPSRDQFRVSVNID
jgi:hypothetical protein